MQREVISNKYDGALPPSRKMNSNIIQLDYVNSNDAAEIDTGIRETIKGVRLSILAMGMGLAKIKAKGLYVDLNYRSMMDYLENLCDEMQIDRSTAHYWLQIGEAYTKYRRDLEKIDFSDADGPTKLPYVEDALEIHEKREVFKAVKELSLRAFKEFSKKPKAITKPSKVRVAGNNLFIGKKLAVSFSKSLDAKTRAYLSKINIQAGEALEAGEILYMTRLYDMDELKRFERGADKLKKDMRINYKPRNRK